MDSCALHDAQEGPPGHPSGPGNVGLGPQGGSTGPRTFGNGQARGAAKVKVAVLPADQSAVLRDRLLGELSGITEPNAATTWARGVLAAKNSLTAADAKIIEDAFEQRVAGVAGVGGGEESLGPPENTRPATAPAPRAPR